MARSLVTSLFLHKPCTFSPQLNTAHGVNYIINTSVIRLPAAKHLAVCRIYNGIRFQAGDIPLPQNKLLMSGYRQKGICIYDSFFSRYFAQKSILNSNKFLRAIFRRPQIHKSAKQSKSAAVSFFQPASILRIFLHQHIQQIFQPLLLIPPTSRMFNHNPGSSRKTVSEAFLNTSLSFPLFSSGICCFRYCCSSFCIR